LQWRDIDFIDSVIAVRKSKTQAGLRLIPLNEDARRAILTLRRNAITLFGGLLSPDWYIFPHAEGNTKPDPMRPMSTWRTAWRSLTKEAGLAGLRFHDLRHHAITELAESSTSEQIIMSIAGHVSAKMLAHYSHVRLEAKRTALSALCNSGEEKVTSQTTSQGQFSGRGGDLMSLKNMVDVTGIEPVTPCLQSRCSPS
jgi:integrase